MVKQDFLQSRLGVMPVVLAPLAGVSDHPFRRICSEQGADLSYVEMISAAALLYESKRTYEMLKRHSEEQILGVQITGKTADETARAIALLEKMPFDTIDINMGCPVNKVVKVGCGSAILKDPQRVYDTVKASVAVTSKPLSVKIRIGWDHQSINGIEVAQAAAEAGAAWITVHGRTRSDDYGDPVNLVEIAKIKRSVNIPVWGNGNLFTATDATYMHESCAVDGLMVSRGALGDPWVFRRIKGDHRPVSLAAWFEVVSRHIDYQREEYGDSGRGAVCMRKHLLWYLRGWPGVKSFKESAGHLATLTAANEWLKIVVDYISSQQVENRQELVSTTNRFAWDPKWEMDRQLDRGIEADASIPL